jgi:hypothetical protein
MSKLHVILDLDSTIIHSLEYSECLFLPTDFQNIFHHKDMIGYVRVFARPHLEYFMDYIFENFDVSVMTAADYGYGWFIIQNFILTKPDRKLNYFFHNYHTELADERYGKHKDLRLVYDIFDIDNMTPNNTVIIDDHPKVQAANKQNVIPVVPPFLVYDDNTNKPNYDMIKDQFLLEAIDKLEEMKYNLETYNKLYI